MRIKINFLYMAHMLGIRGFSGIPGRGDALFFATRRKPEKVGGALLRKVARRVCTSLPKAFPLYSFILLGESNIN